MNAEPLKTFVLWNPSAGTAPEAGAARERLEALGARIEEPDSPEETTRLAREAASGGFERIVAAGGDGTVNAVAAGLLAAPPGTVLAVLPIGTANDFCRSLALPMDPLEALHAWSEGSLRRIDVLRVRGRTFSAIAANIATGGNSGEMAARLTDETKQRWGALAYLRGALDVLTQLTAYRARLVFDDEEERTVELLNLLVANGRTSAGGLEVAPMADLEDGLLDVVVIRDGPPLDVAGTIGRFALSDYLESDLVDFRRASRLRVESDPPMPFTLDGNLVPPEPLEFSVAPRALTVLVGPGYRSNGD